MRKLDLVVSGYVVYDGRVLLIQHKKLGLWLPPGGHIDPNEAPDDALKRELKEEVNLEVELLNRNDIPPGKNIVTQLAVPFYANVHSVGDHDHCCLNYLCSTKSQEDLVINKAEANDYAWLSEEKLSQNRIIPEIRNIALKAFELYKRINHRRIILPQP